MLKCRECKYSKAIQEVTKLPDGQDLAVENQYYWILCDLSGIPETCHITKNYPKSCELLGHPPIKTSNTFKLCQICGTYTIDNNGCKNLNHQNNLDKFLKDDKI